MSQHNVEKLQTAILKIIIAVFALLVIGTMALPAVIAYLYGWQWLTIYPALLVLLILLLPKK